MAKGSELFVRCLENEGIERIFGIPGEENIDVMDVLLDSKIQFVTATSKALRLWQTSTGA